MKIVGTWEIARDRENHSIWTFNSDGTLIGTNSKRSTIHGSYEEVGKNIYQYSDMANVYDENMKYDQIGRGAGKITITEDGNSIEFDGRIKYLSKDGILVNERKIKCTGTKIIV
jgi:hypothetical protein